MRLPALVLLAGCSFDPSGIEHGGVAPDGAAAADARVLDGSPADGANVSCVPWPALNVDPCDPSLPAPMPLELATVRYRFDTDTGVLSSGITSTTLPFAVLEQDGGPDVTALNVTTFSLDEDAALILSGTRPLVVIVHGDSTIDGQLIASGAMDNDLNKGSPGPGGSDDTICGGGVGEIGATSTGAGGGGGGGGGGFGDDGGDAGDGNGAGHGTGGKKGTKSAITNLVPLRGGCAGGAGGSDSVSATDEGGLRGEGGGAIEITARGTIEVTGAIEAGGTGGFAPTTVNAGGGGAGSGGAILLDGEIANVAASASLCANGGGGGEGGQAAQTAEDGEPGTCSEAVRANGGDAIADGGDGGDGGFAGEPKGTKGANGANDGGGGGGGGGIGRIRVRGRSIRSVDDLAILSPTPTS